MVIYIISCHSLFQEHGKLSATASLGLIHMWDVDGGLVPIDKLEILTISKKRKIASRINYNFLYTFEWRN